MGKTPAAATPTQLNSINVDQSRYGDPVPLVYGVQRIPMTLLWYGAFNATAQYNSGGGKGGRGPPSGYAYQASCVMGLCEGPIVQVLQVWKDKDLTTLSTEGLTLFTGAGGQAPWSYLSSNFPGQAVPYDHTAYVAEANLALGNSAALPNYTFEVQGFLARPGTPFSFVSGLAANSYQGQVSSTGVIPDGVWDVTFSDNESRTATFVTTGGVQVASWDSTLGLVNGVTANAIAGGYDAEMSAVLVDYCTNVNHGANFNYLNTSQIQTHSWSSGATTYYDSYKTYVTALGLFVSPYEDTQRKATDFVSDLLEMGNSNAVMSAGYLKIVPYGDSPITGNGVTYTPNLQPLFAFTDDDLMSNNQGTNNDPIVVTRKSLTETYNVVRVEFLDRGNSYNTALAEWTDPLDIAVNGIRVMPNKTFHQICDARVAGVVAALIGQRQLYIRNTYQFTVRADYSLLEPMDLISITDANLGITDLLVRITEIEDDQNDIFTITAEDTLVGTASAPKYNFQLAQGYAANFATLPLSVAAPVIFSAPPGLIGAGGGYELWIAVGQGSDTYAGSTNGTYGGCDVYASLDTTTYNYVGRISGEARYGTIPSNVGATNSSITVTLNAGGIAANLQLSSASASDYANNRALIYLDGEIIGFESATLIGTGEYTLSPVTRGLFGTGPSTGVGVTHSAGASWARLDESIFSFPFDAGMVGDTINLKFTSYNSVGRAEQTLAEATAYPYLIESQSVNQLLGGPLTLQGYGVSISGTSVFKTGTASAYDSGCWSLQGYTNGAFASFSPSSTSGYVMLGLHSAPGLVSHTALDYALETHVGDGTLWVWESGTGFSTGAAFNPGDTLVITYDGANVYYYQNGALLRKVAAAADLTFYLNSSFYTPQVLVTNLQFGPYGSGGAQIYTVASAPAIVLPANSSGVVTSYANANGVLKVYQNTTDITSLCTLSIFSAVNCTGTVNSAANTPVGGEPIGFYEITAMSASTATLTIQATYGGTNYETVITLALSIAGATGATGPAGPPGSGAATPASTTYTGTGSPSTATATVPPGYDTMTVELWADPGSGAASSSLGNVIGAGGASGGYCRSVYPCSSQVGNTLNISLYSGASTFESTVTAGSFTGFTTMGAYGGASGTGTGVGVGGAPGPSPVGGNVANIDGNPGMAGSNDGSLTLGYGGAVVPGIYGAGNPGARGSVTSSARPGRPAVCVVTFS